MIVEFTSGEELAEIINRNLDVTENNAEECLFPRDRVSEIVSFIEKNPAGKAQGNGGHKAVTGRSLKRTTYLYCAWYTLHSIKQVGVWSARHWTEGMDSEARLTLRSDKEARLEALQKLHPDVWARVARCIEESKIKGLPPLPQGFELIGARREGDVAVAFVFDHNGEGGILLVGTPSGWLHVPWHEETVERSPWLYLKDVGLPETARKRKWDSKTVELAVAKGLEFIL